MGFRQPQGYGNLNWQGGEVRAKEPWGRPPQMSWSQRWKVGWETFLKALYANDPYNRGVEGSENSCSTSIYLNNHLHCHEPLCGSARKRVAHKRHPKSRTRKDNIIGEVTSQVFKIGTWKDAPVADAT